MKQKIVDIAVNSGNVIGHVAMTEAQQPETRLFRVLYSLVGELNPRVSPLSLEYSFDDKTYAYRYDWIVGITPLEPWKFLWPDAFSDNRAMCVQLLLDTRKTDLTFAEVSVVLLGMQPSRDSSTWLERHADQVSGLSPILEGAAGIVGVAHPAVEPLLKMSALMSNLVKAHSKDKQNWFTYRFLDEKKNCCAVEWNVNKTVLEQYGPVLRGSIILTFHGTPKANEPMHMLLRPRFTLVKAKELDFTPPYHELEKEDPVMLEITARNATPERDNNYSLNQGL